jgi:glycosyltransferase involved in cell wall biosynthesis
VIGGSGFYKDYLLSLVQAYQLETHVRFLGHIAEETLPEIYQASDFFVLPTSELEGFGLVILEAMACGTPVLGTPVGAIPEILNRFDNRLVFDGTGWNEMKTKLEQIIETPAQYEFDPRDCRHFVEQNYSWKKMAEAFEKVALELI